MSSLREELSQLLNRHCAENTSNTPDYILAMYLEASLLAFDTAVQQRETWYGRDSRPTERGFDISTLSERQADPERANAV